MSKVEGIELAQMLADLRAELIKARAEGEGKDVRFEVADAELEVLLTTTKSADGKGGVKFWVYNAEAGVSGSHEQTHRLKLKLRPTGPDGKSPLPIADQDTLPQ
jgi:hypothetical protein